MKNYVILCIQLGGKFINLDGQDYDTFGATKYTEDEAAARIDELNRETPEDRHLIISVA